MLNFDLKWAYCWPFSLIIEQTELLEYDLIFIIPTITGLENSTRPLVFTSALGCRASENFDTSSEN